jgi:cobalamin-dependent methionine synthase I
MTFRIFMLSLLIGGAAGATALAAAKVQKAVKRIVSPASNSVDVAARSNEGSHRMADAARGEHAIAARHQCARLLS